MKQIILTFLAIFLFSTAYTQSRGIELSHYVMPEFNRSLVLMKDGSTRKVELNYNIVSEEMVFIDNGRKIAIADAEVNRIDTIYLEERKFVVHQGKFVELILKGKVDAFAGYKGKIHPPARPTAYGGTSRSTFSTSYGRLIDDSKIYELELPEGFEVEPITIIYLKKDGVMHEFLNEQQLNRFYSAKRDLIRDYKRNNKVDFRQPETVASLIEFLETH